MNEPFSSTLTSLAAGLRSVVVGLCITLSACSSSDVLLLTGGVGSGGSGLAEGFVSGFGSIIVDGVAYDDSAAAERLEARDGQSGTLPLAIGQQVRLRLDSDGRVEQVEMRPQLRGPVTRAPVDQGATLLLQVLGQPVRLVKQAGTGFVPTTVEGLASPSSLALGTEIEVHGHWVADPVAGAVLMASRIERLPQRPAYYTISGLLSTAEPGLLVLNPSGPVKLIASEPTVNDGVGAELRAWITPVQWQQATASTPWQPLPVTGLAAKAPELQSQARIRLTAALRAGQLDPVTGSLQVQGFDVFVPAALRNQLSNTESRPFALQLRRRDDGRFELDQLSGGDANDDGLGALLRLKAALRWPTTLSDQFSVRGISVSGFAAAAAASGTCANQSSGATVYVELTASRGTPGSPPVVQTVACQQSAPQRAVHEDQGEVLGVEPATDNQPARVLWRPEGAAAPIRIELPDRLNLPPAAIEALSGQRLDIDFQYDNGAPVLRRLRPGK